MVVHISVVGGGEQNGLIKCGISLPCDRSLHSQPLCPGAVVQCTCVVTRTASITHWEVGGMCDGGLLSLAQYPPCAGRELLSSMDSCGSLVAYNPGGGVLSILHTSHTIVQGVEAHCELLIVIGSGTFDMAGKCLQS